MSYITQGELFGIVTYLTDDLFTIGSGEKYHMDFCTHCLITTDSQNTLGHTLFDVNS